MSRVENTFENRTAELLGTSSVGNGVIDEVIQGQGNLLSSSSAAERANRVLELSGVLPSASDFFVQDGPRARPERLDERVQRQVDSVADQIRSSGGIEGESREALRTLLQRYMGHPTSTEGQLNRIVEGINEKLQGSGLAVLVARQDRNPNDPFYFAMLVRNGVPQGGARAGVFIARPYRETPLR